MPAASYFAVVGDVHGSFEPVFSAVRAYEDATGLGVYNIVSVGDLEPVFDPIHLLHMTGPKKYRTIGDLPKFLVGPSPWTLPHPILFVGGNHEPYSHLDDGQITQHFTNLHYFGRSGFWLEENLIIGGLSGIYGPGHETTQHRQKTLFKDCDHALTYYNVQDLELLARMKAFLPNLPSVLILHDWPAGISADEDVRAGLPERPLRIHNGSVRTGSKLTPPLISELQPDLVFCGHMHIYCRGTCMGVPIECLDRAGSDRGPWVAVLRADGERVRVVARGWGRDRAMRWDMGD